jgi:tetratricopeptide (TPR) repeat protein
LRFVVAAGALLVADAGTASNDTIRLSCSDVQQTVQISARSERRPDSGVLLIAEASANSAILVVEEAGRDIEWREHDASPFVEITSRPPRHGVAAWNVTQPRALRLRVREKRHDGAVRAQLFCRPSVEIAALPICLAAPAFWSAYASAGVSHWCDALVRHGVATSAAREGADRQALVDYRHAATLWGDRGDALRKGAALLGATEMLFRLDRYDEAIAQAQQSAQLSRAAGNEYFALRAQGEVCLSLRERGGRQEGRACQQALARDYLRIGETADAANAYISLGSMAKDDGHLDVAQSSLAALDAMDLSQASPDVAPRANLLAAGVALHEGRIGKALGELELAAERFAQSGNQRWLANTQLRIALIYAQLGSVDESRHFAGAALKIFSAHDSPTREALALRILGAAEASVNSDATAAVHFSRARALLADAKSPPGLLALDLAEASARRDAGAAQRAARAIEAGVQPSAQQSARLQLLHAWHAFRAGDFGIADSIAAAVPGHELPLPDYLSLRTLRARLAVSVGDAPGAFASLGSEVERLRRIVAGVQSPALRYVAGRRLGELRAAWIDTYMQASPADRLDLAAFWMMLQKTQRLSMLTGGGGGGTAASEADRQLTQLFLHAGDDAGDSRVLASQRELLRFYLQPRSSLGVVPAGDPVSLQQLQNMLPPGARLIAFAFGDEHLLRFSVTRTEASVSNLGLPSAVRDAASRLRTSLASPAVALSQVRPDVTRLSQLLFGTESGAAPERLFLSTDGELAGIPFALLEWPGNGALLDGTAVSLVETGLEPDSFVPLQFPRRIDVLTSSLPGSADERLPPLTAAQLDTEPLHRTAAATDIAVYADAQFTRQRLFDALAHPQGWVHVAAHGSSESRLQNYSGVWIAPTGSEKAPALVSWLELSERGVRSDLLVLSSCGLGGSPGHGTSGAASFASAATAAGARHVVAALWPVSDVAAAQFAQAFYGHLMKQLQPDVARAVAAAQRTVRENPHFRHPYYWSLFIHLQR